jgi:hypothetical protein
VAEADPGQKIALSWATTGASEVTLWYMMPTGQFGSFWDVPLSGSFDYTIAPEERNQISFMLVASDAAGREAMASLGIPLRCPFEWFFGNHPDICAARAAIYSAGAEQRFERGTMIWVGGQDMIYVLFGDGQSYKWSSFPDQWDPGEPESDPSLIPPPGLFQPVRGFGLVWREQPQVRERLGWALAQEASSNTAVQSTSYPKYNETYILARDSQVWRLWPEWSGWDKLPAG